MQKKHQVYGFRGIMVQSFGNPWRSTSKKDCRLQHVGKIFSRKAQPLDNAQTLTWTKYYFFVTSCFRIVYFV